MHLTPPSPPRRLRGRLLAAGLVCTASVALSACGAEQPAPVTILNTEKVELAIEHSSMTQRGQDADVSCPSGVHQKKGVGFSCTAVVKGHATRFAIAQLDGSGRVRYEAR